MTDETETASPAKKVRGWPKGKPRVRKPLEATREPIRKANLMKAKPNWETYDATEDSEDRLHIPREQIPEGFDLQWVTVAVRGQPEPQRRASFERKGWTPVHPEDFNGVYDGKFKPRGYQGEIEMDGLVLMARPMEFSKKAKREEHRKAVESVRIKEHQLTGGQMNVTGANHPSALGFNKINRTMERVVVPEE